MFGLVDMKVKSFMFWGAESQKAYIPYEKYCHRGTESK